MAFLIIAILILLVVSAKFRLLPLFLVAVAAIGAYVIYLYGERQEALTKSKIPVANVAITDGHILLRSGTYNFTGRITNNSKKFTLDYIELHAVARDCASNTTTQHCVVIGEAHETIQVNVPPGQARDLNEPLYTMVGNLSPKGLINWTYDISQTTAH